MPHAAPVLIADVPELESVLRDCFPADDVVYVSTLADSTMALGSREYRLIIVGLHFDHYSMFELVRYVRTLPRFKRVPIYCIRALPARLTDAARSGIEHAVRLLGAQAFIDVKPGPLAAEQMCKRLTEMLPVQGMTDGR
ncbi:MAG: hypothetical protein JO035_08740 [Betaproteobacteria bacterium]|nr:hypothetical protein [Betaproteobacteria bacterium]